MIFIDLHTFLEFRTKVTRNGCDLQYLRVVCFTVCVCERARAFRGTCALICNRDPKVRKFLKGKSTVLVVRSLVVPVRRVRLQKGEAAIDRRAKRVACKAPTCPKVQRRIESV